MEDALAFMLMTLVCGTPFVLLTMLAMVIEEHERNKK